MLAGTRPGSALRAPGVRRGSAGGTGGTHGERSVAAAPPAELFRGLRGDASLRGSALPDPPARRGRGAAPGERRAGAVTPALAAFRRRERRVSHGGGKEGKREGRGRALPPAPSRSPPLSLRLRADPHCPRGESCPLAGTRAMLRGSG